MSTPIVHVFLDWQLGLPLSKGYPANFFHEALRNLYPQVFATVQSKLKEVERGSIVICSEHCINNEQMIELKQKSCKVLLTTGDERYDFYRRMKPTGLLCFSRHVYETFKDDFEVYFVPFGVSTEFYKPVDLGGLVKPISFCGGLSYEHRKNILSVLRRSFSVYSVHYERSTPVDKVVKYFCSTLINLNINGSTKHGCNCRTFEIPATKSFMLCEWNPDLELFYKLGDECETWKTVDGLIDKIRFYLNNPVVAERIALRGYERTLRDHTYTLRVKSLLHQFEKAGWI